LGLVALLTLIVGPAGVFASLHGTGQHRSPATGHAQVFAHGVSTMLGARLGWKVSQQAIKVIDDQPLATYPLGFAYASTDSVVVNDDDTGAQTELAVGHAVFIANGDPAARQPWRRPSDRHGDRPGR